MPDNANQQHEYYHHHHHHHHRDCTRSLILQLALISGSRTSSGRGEEGRIKEERMRRVDANLREKSKKKRRAKVDGRWERHTFQSANLCRLRNVFVLEL